MAKQNYTEAAGADTFYSAVSSSLGGFSGILLNQGQTSGNYYVFFCANAVTAGTWPSTCGAQTPNNSSGQSYAWGIFIH